MFGHWLNGLGFGSDFRTLNNIATNWVDTVEKNVSFSKKALFMKYKQLQHQIGRTGIRVVNTGGVSPYDPSLRSYELPGSTDFYSLGA